MCAFCPLSRAVVRLPPHSAPWTRRLQAYGTHTGSGVAGSTSMCAAGKSHPITFPSGAKWRSEIVRRSKRIVATIGRETPHPRRSRNPCTYLHPSPTRGEGIGVLHQRREISTWNSLSPCGRGETFELSLPLRNG